MAVYLQRALTVCVLVTQLNPSWKGIKLQVCKHDALRLERLGHSYRITSYGR